MTVFIETIAIYYVFFKLFNVIFKTGKKTTSKTNETIDI